jgi:hypothetical protein
MSESSRDQRLDEYRVFLGFCSQVPGLDVDLRSIERGNPGSHGPDIMCRTKSGAMLMFELSELADEEVKRQTGLLDLGPGSFLTPAEEAKFRRRFRSMDFCLDTPPGNGKTVVSIVINWLRQVGPDYVLPPGATEATIPYSRIPRLRRIRGAIRITANLGDYIGPIFSIAACARFDSGVKKAIRNKARCTYRTGDDDVAPQLILHYSDADPFMRGHGWEEEPDTLRDLWEPHFTDVWMFKEHPPEVLSHHTRRSNPGQAQEQAP